MVLRGRSSKQLCAISPRGLHKGCRVVQRKSWFNSRGRKVTSGTILAQIFFTTDDGELLGFDDCKALDELVEHCEGLLKKDYSMKLTFVGRADVRYYEDYNWKLSALRALAVKKYVDTRLITKKGYSSGWQATGELFSGACWSDDRRVDVYTWQKQPTEKKSKWRQIGFWVDANLGDIYVYKKLSGDLGMRIDEHPSDWYAWQANGCG